MCCRVNITYKTYLKVQDIPYHKGGNWNTQRCSKCVVGFRFLLKSILKIMEKFCLFLSGELQNKFKRHRISNMYNVMVKLNRPKDWRHNLPFFGIISVVMSNHSLHLFLLQLLHWTICYIWLDLYLYTTDSHDTLSAWAASHRKRSLFERNSYLHSTF